ncbi:DUF2264 domain-containing protein [Shouchella clausii]|uniref:DUF2264 domain-containing protein n=1 Tax=Shouchella clausii TaxID=79880 RepID=A0A268RW77_SHOCL|nr:DUF2264 domain-containing protein [Shouchella clausii]PAD14637.1 hypothetical protein CHH74_08370 [Shouchella clausii]PAF24457.1 hypothetical protein CHH61_18535 [Shouchella clausii]
MTINNIESASELKTRDDLAKLLQQILAPTTRYYSEGYARLELGGTGAAYANSVAGFEGFSRLLWGLVPLLAGSEETDHQLKLHLEGMKNGTNPWHPEYWGDVTDYDQRVVEMAVFGLALLLIPEKIWAPLQEKEKENLYHWLAQINAVDVWDCNWLFFPVLVNLGFKQVGLPYDQRKIADNLERIDQFYLENGWYGDGLNGHRDYYVSFALHYYGLVYAKVMEKDDPVRAERYKARSTEFAKAFIYWFAENGSAIPYGRSMTYRFAQAAFWSAAIFAGITPFSLGVMKGLLFRHLRWWCQQPIFDNRRLLTIGYAYPNLITAENYNSPGSPYWALKVFLPLALDQDDSFWEVEEEPLPRLEKHIVQEEPRFILCRDARGHHAFAFNAGHLSTNGHTHTAAKYEKFVYSTAFGFSVPRAEWGLEQGAFDSTLALSERDNLYRVKRQSEEYAIARQFLYTKWRPWQDVEITTWLIPCVPWHVRVHKIETNRLLDAADGGFALGLGGDGSESFEQLSSGASCLAKTATAASGIVNLREDGETALIFPHANTNLLHPRTVIPTVRTRIDRGTTFLVSAVYGEVDGHLHAQSWAAVPSVRMFANKLIVSWPNREPIEVALYSE